MQPYFAPRRTAQPADTQDQSRMKKQPTSWFQFWNPKSSPTRPLPRATTSSQKPDQPPEGKEQQLEPAARTSPTKTPKEVPDAAAPTSSASRPQKSTVTQGGSASDDAGGPAAGQAQPQNLPAAPSQGARATGLQASGPARLARSRSSRDAEPQKKAPMTPQTSQKRSADASQAKTSEMPSLPSDAAPPMKPVSDSVLKFTGDTKPLIDKPQAQPSPQTSPSSRILSEASKPQSQEMSQHQPMLPPPPSKSTTLKGNTTDDKVLTKPTPRSTPLGSKPKEKATMSPQPLNSQEEITLPESKIKEDAQSFTRYADPKIDARKNREAIEETSLASPPQTELYKPAETLKMPSLPLKSQEETTPLERQSLGKSKDKIATQEVGTAATSDNDVSLVGRGTIDLTKQKSIESTPFGEAKHKGRIGPKLLEATKDSVEGISSTRIKQNRPSSRQNLSQMKDASKSSGSGTSPNKLGVGNEPKAQTEKPPHATKPTSTQPIVPKPSKLPSIRISQHEQLEKPSTEQDRPPIQNESTKKDESREISFNTTPSPPAPEEQQEQPSSLHKDIKLGISRLVQNLAVGYPKQGGNDHDICIITLAGENKGASMIIGQKMPATDDYLFPIQRSYEQDHNRDVIAIDESTEALKKAADPKSDNQAKSGCEHNVTINSNTQGINNSILQNSSCCERDPGVHLNLANKPEEAVKSSTVQQQDRHVTYRGGQMMQAKKLTYEPTVKRRCLRALFLESGESDPENPQKPRRHGCQFTCNDEKNKGRADDI